ncbi:hypothetical protein ASC90_15915 [Rhizobium sp. Root1220]|nr:hypothetical protein ASC90_15915 [Rhizobium sp. Root1220]
MAPAMALTACTTTESAVATKESNLAAAGFVARPANTPKRQAMLKRLPPNTFLSGARGSNVTFVYADPVDCKCLYVGSQQAYAQYRRSQQQARLATRQRLAAQPYADSDWDWGEWGPWVNDFSGPFGPGSGW